VTVSKVFTIAYYTLKEILKSKILLSIFLIGIGLVLVTYVATEFSYGVPQRIALDFGLGMLSISSLAISLFLGVTLLSKELDSRTVYMVISRPVPRFAFIIGKIIGLLGVQALNVLFLSLMTLVSVYFLGGQVSSLIFWTVGFIFLESMLLLFVVILMSLITNNILSTLISIVLLILGHAVKETQSLLFVKKHAFIEVALRAYHFTLPAFYKLNLKDFVLYKTSLPLDYLCSSLVYGVSYSAFLLILIILIFNRKNLD
jgi:ABC-type transport system involved in multi-copper enzyme maturation permease subunit